VASLIKTKTMHWGNQSIQRLLLEVDMKGLTIMRFYKIVLTLLLIL